MRLLPTLSLLLSACLLCSGCHGSDHTTDAGAVSGGASEQDFCRNFIHAVCDHYERCACDPQMIEECRAQLEGCEESSQQATSRALINSGELIYHPEVFERLAVRLRDPKTSCETYFGDFGLDSVSVYSFDGVYEGTREPGQPCTSALGKKGGINTCKAGALCWPDETGAGRCLTLVGKGKPCDVGPTRRNLCFDRRPPDADNEFETSFYALTCVASAASSATGTCSDHLEDGSVCRLDEACKSGRCAETTGDDNVCTAKLPDGAKCQSREDCSSGACSRVCGAPFPDGAYCGYDDLNCASGSCHTVDDGSSGTSPGSCGPKRALPLGATCTQGHECASGVCRDSACRNHVCR